ncbi:hypothetical protein AB6A40_005290 [Gnathostoma spinigerum]|uniref:Uncharacterized protein n=1 Tax=Gnathostoma spinigerum TaxID=75299 RepID=A0ABD6EMC0_9BILA
MEFPTERQHPIFLHQKYGEKIRSSIQGCDERTAKKKEKVESKTQEIFVRLQLDAALIRIPGSTSPLIFGGEVNSDLKQLLFSIAMDKRFSGRARELGHAKVRNK